MGGRRPDTVDGGGDNILKVRGEIFYYLYLIQHEDLDTSDGEIFIEEEGEGTLGPAAVDLNKIVDIIQALASSVFALQLQEMCGEQDS